MPQKFTIKVHPADGVGLVEQIEVESKGIPVTTFKSLRELAKPLIAAKDWVFVQSIPQEFASLPAGVTEFTVRLAAKPAPTAEVPKTDADLPTTTEGRPRANTMGGAPSKTDAVAPTTKTDALTKVEGGPPAKGDPGGADAVPDGKAEDKAGGKGKSADEEALGPEEVAVLVKRGAEGETMLFNFADSGTSRAKATLEDLRKLMTAAGALAGGQWTFQVGNHLVMPGGEARRTVESCKKITATTPASREAEREAERDVRREARFQRTVAAVDAVSARLAQGEDQKFKREELLTDRALDGAAKVNSLARLQAPMAGQVPDNALSISQENRTKLLRMLGLPRVIRQNVDGSMSSTAFAAELFGPGADFGELASRYVVATSSMDLKVDAFDTEQQQTAFVSGYANIAVSFSAGYEGLGGGAALSGSVDLREGHASRVESGEKGAYIAGVFDVARMRVHIPRAWIRLSDEVTRRIEEAMREIAKAPPEASKEQKEAAAAMTVEVKAAADKAAAAKDAAELRKAVKRVLDDVGYYVCTDYTLGGRLKSTEKQDSKDVAAQTRAKFDKRFAAAIDGSINGFKGSASGGYGWGSEDDDKKVSTRLNSAIHIVAVGGRGYAADKPGQWLESLSYDNWEIITYDKLVPIYEFLTDKTLKEACLREVNIESGALQAKFAEAAKEKRHADICHAVDATQVKARQMAHNPLDPSPQLHPFGALVAGRPSHTGVDTRKMLVPVGHHLRGLALCLRPAKWKNQDNVKVLGLELRVAPDTHPTRIAPLVDAAEVGDISWQEVLLGGKDPYWYFNGRALQIPQGTRVTSVALAHDDNQVQLSVEVADMDLKNPQTLRVAHGDCTGLTIRSPGVTPDLGFAQIPNQSFLSGIALGAYSKDDAKYITIRLFSIPYKV